MRKSNFVKDGYSFRPTLTKDGSMSWGVYRKGERTWSSGAIAQSSDLSCFIVSSHMQRIDARADFDSAVALLLSWLGAPAVAPKTYLDRFPAEAAPYVERAYQEGFEDGANA